MPTSSVKRTLVTILVASTVAVGAIAYAVTRAGYWLQAPARSPVRADAIVVLGGNDGDRALRALDLYRDGYAPNIVLTGFEQGSAAPPLHLAWRAEFLADRGVPKSALRYEIRSDNSFEEATAIRELMKRQGWASVIAVSDPPHMRRLAWTWDRVFNGSGMHYVLVASGAPWWTPGDWWRDEHSGAFVITEYIKLAYYVAKR